MVVGFLNSLRIELDRTVTNSDHLLYIVVSRKGMSLFCFRWNVICFRRQISNTIGFVCFFVVVSVFRFYPDFESDSIRVRHLILL